MARSTLGLVLAVLMLACAHAPARAATIAAAPGQFAPGTIVIVNHQRRLFLALGDGRAISYPVGVGKAGKRWLGYAHVDGKYVRPAWSPPDDVKRDNPSMPAVIPPGPHNPMGERALTLDRGQYAIHGTNRPNSVGKFVSYGCIRMHNADVIDLFDRVRVGTLVVVEP